MASFLTDQLKGMPLETSSYRTAGLPPNARSLQNFMLMPLGHTEPLPLELKPGFTGPGPPSEDPCYQIQSKAASVHSGPGRVRPAGQTGCHAVRCSKSHHYNLKSHKVIQVVTIILFHVESIWRLSPQLRPALQVWQPKRWTFPG